MQGGAMSGLVDFIKEYFWPVGNAMRRLDFEAAAEALERARAALPRSEDDPALAECGLVVFEWHEFWLKWKQALASDGDKRFYAGYIARLTEPCRSSEAEQYRLKSLLVTRLDGDSAGCDAITREEIEALLDRIQDSARNTFIWTQVSTWAFEHRQADLSAKAVEVLLTGVSGKEANTMYLRAVLLHGLLTETASPSMVRQHVSVMRNTGLRKEFIENILPECERQGLVDEEVRAMLAPPAEQQN